MKAHIDAISALVPYPTYFVDVPSSPTYPYVLLWSSAGAPGREFVLAGVNEDIDEPIGVTAVAATPSGVLTMQKAIRAVLNPGGALLGLVVPGRAASIRLYDSRPIDVDREVSIPSSNRHPALGVDMYRITSTPAQPHPPPQPPPWRPA